MFTKPIRCTNLAIIMEEKNTLQKGTRVLQASTFDDWRLAPRPNYATNSNLKFPYSEYPRKHEYEYISVRLPQLQADGDQRILDFWGEGRIIDGTLVTGFPGAYNVNHQFQLVSNGADRGKKIPNRIPTLDYNDVSVAKYVPSGSFDRITLMGAPISEETATEIARIISGDSHSVVVIYGYPESNSVITVLERELDYKELNLLLHYDLPAPLNEITEKPALAFRPTNTVVADAQAYFLDGEMRVCADILCSLKRSSNVQSSAKLALNSFFSASKVKNSYMIFALGYELKTTSDGRDVMSSYMNSNVVRIVQTNYNSLSFVSNYGKQSYLCTNGKVSNGSWQWAFFGTSNYIDSSETYKGGDKLSLVPHNQFSEYEFQVECNFGSQSYLCVNDKVPVDSWQWAFFGTPSYLSSATYHDGQYFRLYPIKGGEKFGVQSRFGSTSRLCVNGKVSTYEWGFFGTPEEIDSGYAGGDIFTLVFN